MANDYPGATRDRQGPGGEQEEDNRRRREEQAAELNRELGIEGGNLESFLSGRNTYEGYKADQLARTTNVPGGGTEDTGGQRPPTTTGGDGGGGVSSAYKDYLDLSPVTAIMQQMQAQQAADRARQEQERAEMRGLLRDRMGQAAAPISVDAPGVKEILAAQRLSRQRSEERQRSQLAARLAPEGLLDSGAFDTGLAGIQQARGEGESADIAEVLTQEHQAKRQELLQLYQMALSMGDAEAARTLQQQIASLDAGLQELQLAEGSRRFDQDLGFRKSSFLDNLGLQLMLAQLRANQSAAEYF